MFRCLKRLCRGLICTVLASTVRSRSKVYRHQEFQQSCTSEWGTSLPYQVYRSNQMWQKVSLIMVIVLCRSLQSPKAFIWNITRTSQNQKYCPRRYIYFPEGLTCRHSLVHNFAHRPHSMAYLMEKVLFQKLSISIDDMINEVCNQLSSKSKCQISQVARHVPLTCSNISSLRKQVIDNEMKCHRRTSACVHQHVRTTYCLV